MLCKEATLLDVMYFRKRLSSLVIVSEWNLAVLCFTFSLHQCSNKPVALRPVNVQSSYASLFCDSLAFNYNRKFK